MLKNQRILEVACTNAEPAAAENPAREQISEAIQCRSLARQLWT